MGGFCRTHVGERTTEELHARRKVLADMELMGDLDKKPGLRKELRRIENEILARHEAKVSELEERWADVRPDGGTDG